MFRTWSREPHAGDAAVLLSQAGVLVGEGRTFALVVVMALVLLVAVAASASFRRGGRLHLFLASRNRCVVRSLSVIMPRPLSPCSGDSAPPVSAPASGPRRNCARARRRGAPVVRRSHLAPCVRSGLQLGPEYRRGVVLRCSGQPLLPPGQFALATATESAPCGAFPRTAAPPPLVGCFACSPRRLRATRWRSTSSHRTGRGSSPTTKTSDASSSCASSSRAEVSTATPWRWRGLRAARTTRGGRRSPQGVMRPPASA